MPRKALALTLLSFSIGCRILPAPPPETPPGTRPIEERPAELSVEDVRSWRSGDRILSTFGLRKTVFVETLAAGGTHSRLTSFTAWRGSCRIGGGAAACRILPRGTSTVSMSLGLEVGDAIRGAWFDDAGVLELVDAPGGLAIREGEKILAEVAFDRRPVKGWIDADLPEVDRIRIAPLLLTIAAMPDPGRTELGLTGTATRAADVVDAFPAEEARSQRAPVPAWGPDFRSARPIFFGLELVGIGGSFPLATPPPERGAPASISPRPGYSIAAGLDYRDFLQVLFQVQAKGVAFDETELQKVTPPGPFRVSAPLRYSLLARMTFFRAGPLEPFVGLEHVWLRGDRESIFHQSDDLDTRADTGFIVTARINGRGWAPQLGLRYKLGPVLAGGDWWSGISMDVLLEGRYELITWDAPVVDFRSLSGADVSIARARRVAEAWQETYPAPTRSRHLGGRVGLQIRF